MECKVCGHKHRVLNEDWEVENTDTEPFILIKGNFTVSQAGFYHDLLTEVSLHACPMCNTVQVEI